MQEETKHNITFVLLVGSVVYQEFLFCICSISDFAAG